MIATVENEVIRHAGEFSFVNRAGRGNRETVIFLHGSGPGATAWSNWQFALPIFGEHSDAIAPDFIGFGKSFHPDSPPLGAARWLRLWVGQVLALMDALQIEKAHVVGNSLGGAVALHLLAERPERFGRVVLMGSAGASGGRMRPELDAIWGFYDDPSVGRMKRLIRWFAHDQDLFAGNLDDIANMRFEAAMTPEVRRSYAAMFPPPRESQLQALAVPDTDLRRIGHAVLLIHGRDDVIVPLDASLHLLQYLGGPVQLHVYGRCSHWTQIEFRDSFHRLVASFLSDGL